MSDRRAIVVLALGSVALAGGLAAWVWERSPPPEAGARARAPVAATGAVASALPKEKPCLAAPTHAGEDEMVASAGLEPEAVRGVMRSAVQGTLKCFAGSPSVTMMLTLNVACSGRVAKVDVADDGGASPEVQRCVQDVLRYAAFPAHALPDGDSFDYPLVYNAP
ncbi:MAG: hypothetical protein ACOZNI_09695 [Myxococcota bacterium]